MRRIANLVVSQVGLAMLALALGLSDAQAQAVNTDRAGLALMGYDPVAYFTEMRPVLGSEQFTARHDSATYRFVSAANREAFRAAPERYVPLYGGYCAFGVARGYKVKIDPEAFRVEGGRLYLNYSKSVQKEWLKDVPGYIARADSNWSTLKDKPRK